MSSSPPSVYGFGCVGSIVGTPVAPRERREQEQRREAAEAAGRGHRRGGAWAFGAFLASHCTLARVRKGYLAPVAA